MTTGEELLKTLADRDTLETALQRLLRACRNSYLGDSDPDMFDAMEAAAALLPNNGWTPPSPPKGEVLDAGGEVLTVSAAELHPFDRLADGRYVIAMHSAVGGRWVTMDVAEVHSECTVHATLGGERFCLWDHRWETEERVPVPIELSIVRGSRPPGYTCTAPGDPEQCENCPARQP